MPTVETATWLAVKARISALSIGLTVAWPNESLDPKPASYLRITWLPNTNRRLFLNGADPHQRLSLLRADVFAPRNQNAAVAIELAGQVAAHFPTDLPMTYGDIVARVTKAPDPGQPIDDDTHLLVPVSIPIEVFA
jgi:hypothetical protein